MGVFSEFMVWTKFQLSYFRIVFIIVLYSTMIYIASLLRSYCDINAVILTKVSSHAPISFYKWIPERYFASSGHLIKELNSILSRWGSQDLHIYHNSLNIGVVLIWNSLCILTTYTYMGTWIRVSYTPCSKMWDDISTNFLNKDDFVSFVIKSYRPSVSMLFILSSIDVDMLDIVNK